MTIKLTTILNESNAAEEAKKRGLISKAFGYWANKAGKIIARTVNDKLEPVKTDSDQDTKPTNMSAADAGIKPNNSVRPMDVEKGSSSTSDASKVDSDRDEDESEENGEEIKNDPPKVTPNPYLPTQEWDATPLDSSKVKEFLPTNYHDDERFDEIIIGEEVYTISARNFDKFTRGTIGLSLDEKQKHDEEARTDAYRQQREWRDKLSKPEQDTLWEIQRYWQASSQFLQPKHVKDRVNKVLNRILNKKPPPTIKTTQPIERGMRLFQDDAKAFLQNFRIGEDIDLPPSGFSSSLKAARGYANIQDEQIGILMQLIPNRQGEIYGMRLHDQIIPEDKPDVKTVAEDFNFEMEIIRQSGPKARCVRVKKYLIDSSINGSEYWHVPSIRVCYVLQMEEQGYSDDQLIESFEDNNKPDPIFKKIMNTPFGFWRPKSIKLKDIIRM